MIFCNDNKKYGQRYRLVKKTFPDIKSATLISKKGHISSTSRSFLFNKVFQKEKLTILKKKKLYIK